MFGKKLRLVVLIFLVISLPAVLYLVSKTQIFTPRAYTRDLNVLSAARRQEALLLELEKSPDLFLKKATLYSQRSTFPLDVQAFIEEKKEITGKLINVHFDDFQNQKSQDRVYLETQDQVFSLYKYKSNLLTGAQIKTGGVILGSNLVVTPDFNTQIISAPPSSISKGDQKVVVFLVNFSDRPLTPVTMGTVRENLFTESFSINALFREVSFSQIGLSGDVYGWYTLPAQTCHPSTIWSLSKQIDKQAILNRIDLTKYQRIVYAFPDTCGSWGQATLGGNPSRAWIFGAGDFNMYVHELAHNLGSHHAGMLRCGAKQIDYYYNCRFNEYGDTFDPLGGAGGNLHFNAPHKIAFGWIPQERVQTIRQSGTYTVTQEQTFSTSFQALKIAKPDTGEFYYLSYRQPLGFDRIFTYSNIIKGVGIHIWNANPFTPTKFLNLNPGVTPIVEGLLDGQTFNDPFNQITVTQLGHNNSFVTVQIILPEPTPTPTPRFTPIIISRSPSSTPRPPSRVTPTQIPIPLFQPQCQSGEKYCHVFGKLQCWYSFLCP